MFCDDNLLNYYKTNFDLIYHHDLVTLTELENMLPFEREVYILMLLAQLQQEREKIRQKGNG